VAKVDSESKDIGLGRELGRKAIHLGALVMPMGLWFIPSEYARPALFAAFLISASIDITRWTDTRFSRWLKNLLHLVLRPHEDDRFSGGTHILAAGALCAILFAKPIAVAALICIILGDTAAAFVGMSIGRIKIFWNKTLEGSLAFFVASLLGILWIPGLSLQAKVIGAATAAFVEALPIRIDDNITVPLAAGAVMTWLVA